MPYAISLFDPNYFLRRLTGKLMIAQIEEQFNIYFEEIIITINENIKTLKDSNHAEWFADKRKVFKYSISKLYDLINNHLLNYVSGLLTANQCERIKKDLLQKQVHYNIQPVAECLCQTNFCRNWLLEMIILWGFL